MILLYWALTALLVVLVVRAVLSWFPPGGPVFEQVNRIAYVATEWLLAPVRRIVPPVRLGGVALDLSFMVVFVAVLVLQGLVASLAS
jgi:YggT family protein